MAGIFRRRAFVIILIVVLMVIITYITLAVRPTSTLPTPKDIPVLIPVTARQLPKLQPNGQVVNANTLSKPLDKSKVDKYFFHPSPVDRKRADYMELIREFNRTMLANNIRWIVYAGTMLGAYRHHGFTPWDDDFDVWVSEKDKSKFPGIFAKHPTLDVQQSSGNWQWWVILRKTPMIGKQHSWPYMDVFWFAEDATQVRDKKLAYRNWPKEEVFPPVLYYFEGLLVPGPRDAVKVITKTFSENALENCAPTGWNHTMGERIVRDKFITPCSSLYPHHPFVFRQCSGKVLIETLEVNGKVISEIKYDPKDWIHQNRVTVCSKYNSL